MQHPVAGGAQRTAVQLRAVPSWIFQISRSRLRRSMLTPLSAVTHNPSARVS
jgi:hypothetical protein